MRRFLAILTGTLILAAIPAAGQEAVVPMLQLPYKIDFNSKSNQDLIQFDRKKPGGGTEIMLTVQFLISPVEGVDPEPGKNYKVVIEEDGKFVKEVIIPTPKRSEDLVVVMAMDISGSMNEHGRMKQARKAAGVFFKSLPAKADSGLILFNHKSDVSIPPPADRNLLRQKIEAATPSGGTAYLDATLQAIGMLKPSIFKAKGKAVVLLTDGQDVDSDADIDKVVALAKQEKVRIYTVGIGEPGRQERVTSVLVLDKSGSMNQPASDTDKSTKIEALRSAAARFVNSIGSIRRTSIIEFSDAVQNPSSFTNNKHSLRNAIKTITAKGETALFDAVYTAVATLDAEGPDGKRAVVALTDGIDNMSRRRVDEVVARAKEAKIPLFMLGFGRKGELDVKTMEDMAKQTSGKFYHAENEKKLLQDFEDLTNKLHDDGVNEDSLIQLAGETGGRYYSAKNVEKLDFILEEVTKKIQATSHSETFKSLSQVADGRRRDVTLKLLRSTGKGSGKEGEFEVIGEKKTGYQVRGLVIAEMNPMVYLPLLGILVGLIALPAMLKRRTKST